MIIPDWLPTSTLLVNDKDNTNFQIMYELRAYFEPVHMKDWVSPEEKISLFRGARSIFVNQPAKVFPQLKLTS